MRIEEAQKDEGGTRGKGENYGTGVKFTHFVGKVLACLPRQYESHSFSVGEVRGF